MFHVQLARRGSLRQVLPRLLAFSLSHNIARKQKGRVSRSRLFAARSKSTGFALIIPLMLSSLSRSLAGPPVSSSWGHKVQINDPALAVEALAQGGRLVGDYGAYQLFDVPEFQVGLAADPRVQLRDEYNQVLLNAARLDTTRPEVQALRASAGDFEGKRIRLLQFAGPVQRGWHEALEACGVQIVAFVPHNAYLVYGDKASLRQVEALAAAPMPVQWEGPFLDDFKIPPAAKILEGKGPLRAMGPGLYALQLVADAAANAITAQLIEHLKVEPIARKEHVGEYLNIVVRLRRGDLRTLAGQPDVLSIQPYVQRRKFCERQDQILAGNLNGNVPLGPGYLAWLAGKGFTQAQFDASGFAVDVSDSGIDNGTTNPNHFGLHQQGGLANPGRVLYARLEGSPNAGSTNAGCDGHGTLNAHIVGGYDDLAGFPFADASGYHYGLGVCPFVTLGSSVIFDPDLFTNPSYNNLESDAWNSGARISNNSWGASTSGAYDIDAQNFDALVRDAEPPGSSHAAAGNQEMVIVFAAGNDGPNPQTVGSPGTAKNVITIGAADSVQPFGGADGSGVTDAQASSADEIVSFSSRGPCSDGRHKPDLVAPGTHVSGGVDQTANPGPDGTADACFNGTGVSGGPNSTLYWPANQQYYTASSGTSHATPGVSGACALVRQYFLNSSYAPPSPAMTKGYLMNSARYLNGNSAGGTLWSDSQGLGEADLGVAFDGTARILRDQLPADRFTASGQSRTFTGTIPDPTKPFRVTLAWTDAPGNTVGNAYNNDLDLTVSAGGKSYLGNVFQGSQSATGGSPDTRNNVESVFLPAGLSGSFVVQVIATDINSDGVPNNSDPLDQDFALVVYNATAATGPVISSAGSVLLAESCSPTNGAVDPGETVTMSFSLQNLGTANTANLVATLLATNGVSASAPPQYYGVLSPGGPAVSQPFSFTAQGLCGGLIAATFELRDGSTLLGNVAFSLRLGQAVPFVSLQQNFDTVAVPMLPSGWTTTASGGGSLWTTSAAAASTAPNAAFVPDAASIGLADLLSPVVSIASSAAEVVFDNCYDLEADTTYGVAYDGGVLELKIGNGAFTDILAAGGRFLSGGYNLGIDATLDNPLAGRAAWSGSSGGFITTRVSLPEAVAGQNIQLKWRLGTDTGNTSGGSSWYIDNIVVQDVSYACCATNPEIDGITVSRTNVTVSINSSAGYQYMLQYKDSLTDPQWLPLTAPAPGTGGSLILVDTNAPGVGRFYRVSAR